MNSARMAARWFIVTAGIALLAFFSDGWVVASAFVLSFAMAWPVVTRIFDAAERGDFPGFIEDVFPAEVAKARERQEK